MSNTTATGGYLSPLVQSPPLEDSGLDAFFQQMVAGITGLPGNMVRPRWQPYVPKQPEPSIDWCAIGITIIEPDAGPYIVHDGAANAGLGLDHMQRHESIDLACTFYGPQAATYAAIFRDGIALPPNTDILRQNGMGLVECGEFRAVPDIVNQQWIRRYDIVPRFRRQVLRDYPVLNIVSVPDQITADTGISVGGITS